MKSPDEARAALKAATQDHGGQARLARQLAIPACYVSQILTSGRLPSARLAEQLEATLGIPAGAWRPRGRAAAVLELRERIRDEGWPGQLAGRCGLTPEGLEDVLAGRTPPAEKMRALCAEKFRIPWASWDA
jgi:transcriptional regulator with XRE-family HTH domain